MLLLSKHDFMVEITRRGWLYNLHNLATILQATPSHQTLLPSAGVKDMTGGGGGTGKLFLMAVPSCLLLIMVLPFTRFSPSLKMEIKVTFIQRNDLEKVVCRAV